MKISKIITDKYKLCIPPAVYYALLADVQEAEDEQEPREVVDYENEIADLYNRLDIAEYDKEILREEVTNLETKIKALKQEPKTGHWIALNDDYFDWYECSECGYGDEGEMQYSSEYDVRTNYCPRCGAKMESEGEK